MDHDDAEAYKNQLLHEQPEKFDVMSISVHTKNMAWLEGMKNKGKKNYILVPSSKEIERAYDLQNGKKPHDLCGTPVYLVPFSDCCMDCFKFCY